MLIGTLSGCFGSFASAATFPSDRVASLSLATAATAATAIQQPHRQAMHRDSKVLVGELRSTAADDDIAIFSIAKQHKVVYIT
jgi:hypothetical protein